MNAEVHSLGLKGSEPAWSPDDAWIVCSNHDNYMLWFVRPDGTDAYIISSLPGESPQWTPQGDQVLARFGWKIIVVDPESQKGRTVFGLPTGNDIDEFALSPQGTRIATIANGSELYIVDWMGQVQHHLRGQFTDACTLSWSRDEEWLTFDASFEDGQGRGIAIYRPSTDTLKVLHQGGSSPVWSPTENLIALRVRGNRHGVSDVLILNPHTQRVSRTISLGGQVKSYGRAFTWSPDGTKIAFQRERNRVFREKKWELCVLDVRKEQVASLIENFQGTASPSWSPDSAQLVVDRWQESGYYLHVIKPAL